MAADFTSPTWDIRGMYAGCIEIAWTGVNSASCSFKLQGSGSTAIWCDVRNSTHSITATGTGDHIFEFTNPRGYNYIRLVFTAGANTAGSMTALTITKFERNGDNPGRGL